MYAKIINFPISKTYIPLEALIHRYSWTDIQRGRYLDPFVITSRPARIPEVKHEARRASWTEQQHSKQFTVN